MTMSGIKKEDMGNASAIYNLLRNLGGSFGTAFVTTVLSRRAQFHQAHLVEHLSPFDNAYQSISGQRFLQQRAFRMPCWNRGTERSVPGGPQAGIDAFIQRSVLSRQRINDLHSPTRSSDEKREGRSNNGRNALTGC